MEWKHFSKRPGESLKVSSRETTGLEATPRNAKGEVGVVVPGESVNLQCWDGLCGMVGAVICGKSIVDVGSENVPVVDAELGMCVDAGARARVLGRVGDVLFLRDRVFRMAESLPGRLVLWREPWEAGLVMVLGHVANNRTFQRGRETRRTAFG
jgi:hypothetical protein